MEEITKLKAEVYDLLAQQEQIQHILRQKNQHIAELQSKEPEVVDKKQQLLIWYNSLIN